MFACPRSALDRSADVKFASVRSAPNSVTPARLEFWKFARFMLYREGRGQVM